MLLEIIFAITFAVLLAGMIYFVFIFLENTAWNILHEEQNLPIIITSSRLGRELSQNHGSFQDRYYLRIVQVTGKITSSRIVQGSKHHVELEGGICCEFNERQGWVITGLTAEIRGMCMGRILTACEILQTRGGTDILRIM